MKALTIHWPFPNNLRGSGYAAVIGGLFYADKTSLENVNSILHENEMSP